jgi:hypothetical protein
MTSGLVADGAAAAQIHLNRAARGRDSALALAKRSGVVRLSPGPREVRGNPRWLRQIGGRAPAAWTAPALLGRGVDQPAGLLLLRRHLFR